MAVRVRFFAYFREVFGGKDLEVPLSGAATIGALLESLGDTPRRRDELFSGGGLKPHLVVLINGAPLARPAPLETPLRDGDLVAIFPLLGGG